MFRAWVRFHKMNVSQHGGGTRSAFVRVNRLGKKISVRKRITA